MVLLFQEVLHFQDKFSKHYAEGLDGCGLELEEKVRSGFYAFVRYIVKAIDESSRTGLHRLARCFPSYSTFHVWYCRVVILLYGPSSGKLNG